MRPLRAGIVILCMSVNLCLWGIPVVVGTLFRVLIDRTPLRRRMILVLARLAENWVAGNNLIIRTLLPTEWDIEGIDGMRYDGRYLIVSNHLSWVDIFALFLAFHRHAAFIRFFLKRELIWVPIAGAACWGLDFPFMRRYSAEYVAKHPEKKGTDLETTRRAVQRYRDIRVAILNFLEGTRFTWEKHADQQSPYKHLLRPRIGGIAFVFASLGDQLDAFFDVTLAYPGHEVRLWEFLGGGIPRIVIRARRVPVPAEFCTEAVTQPGPTRDAFKGWIEGLWAEKDRLLDTLVGD